MVEYKEWLSASPNFGTGRKQVFTSKKEFTEIIFSFDITLLIAYTKRKLGPQHVLMTILAKHESRANTVLCISLGTLIVTY